MNILDEVSTSMKYCFESKLVVITDPLRRLSITIAGVKECLSSCKVFN